MIEPKHSLKAVAAAITTVLVAHGAHQPEVCFVEKYDCPEPEQKLADEEAHGRPSGPTGPSASSNITTRPTGQTGSAAILEGTDSASGTGPITPGTGVLNLTGTDAHLTMAPAVSTYQQPDEYPNLLMSTLAQR
jgi:hypothetical protein